ncbi:hypothetical protein [Celeribacter indicus]|nr:hypothetical protein [Celeribacter indicus]SDX33972.1 Type IV pili methyl-accepting chemotaxis transducer N-term [Celeribacter indicus]
MNRILHGLLLTMAIALALPAAAGEAMGTDQQTRLIARQGALAHRLVRGMCFIRSGIALAQNERVVQETLAEMDRGFAALYDGDAALGVPPPDATMRGRLDRANALRTRLTDPAQALLAGDEVTTETLVTLSARAAALETLWHDLHEAIEQAHRTAGAGEEVLRGQVIATAGAQSRLLQAAGSSACLVDLAGGREAAPREADRLAKAIDTFDRNVFALTFLRPAAAPEMPNSPELETAATAVWIDWNGQRPLFTALASPDATAETRRVLEDMSYGIEFLDRELEDTLAIFMRL